MQMEEKTAMDGVLVVALEQAVAAPLASSRLADAGARVIKLERPEGDFARRYDDLVKGQSAYFVWLNRGKEAVCVDLTSAGDRALIEAMIAQADVFIQNLKPGTTDRFGLGSARLRRDHPRLITCDISGFGTDGPYAHLKAYDLIIQAESGLCDITGNAAGPARVGISVCDIATGMAAHAAILEALYVRERTGEGRAITLSLFDVLADWMNVPMLQLRYGRRSTPRAGVSHPSLAPYGAYLCADGRSVIFSVQNEREWRAFADIVLGRPDLIEDEDFRDNMARLTHRERLEAVIGAAFRAIDSRDAMASLEAAKIAYGRLNSLAEAIEHPQLRATMVETPGGSIELAPPPARLDGQEPRLRAVPDLGEHDVAIRREFANASVGES